MKKFLNRIGTVIIIGGFFLSPLLIMTTTNPRAQEEPSLVFTTNASNPVEVYRISSGRVCYLAIQHGVHVDLECP